MKEIAQLIGGGLGSLFVMWFLFMLAVSAAMPFMLISVVRNVAKMRRALERIADGGGTSGPASPGSILHT